MPAPIIFDAREQSGRLISALHHDGDESHWRDYADTSKGYRLGRAFLISWAADALSDDVRAYRLATLADAFALRPDYLRRYLADNPPPAMGRHLVDELVAWCVENPDLSPNCPSRSSRHWMRYIDYSGG